MTAPRPQHCLALDPVPSMAGSGAFIHRHCTLLAGHEGLCESVDAVGELVHRWQWHDGNAPAGSEAPADGAEGRLF